MRFSLLLLIVLYSGTTWAEWTGVELTLANQDSDWDFGDRQLEARMDVIGFQIEEQTETSLRIGVGLGHMAVRLVGDTPMESRRFDAQYLGVYLRQPVTFGEHFGLHGLLRLRYHSGDDNEEVNPAGIDWTETRLQFGVSLRLGQFRVSPYVAYTDVDGDLSDDSGTSVFEQEEPVSQGLRIDYLVDSSAFVRLEFESGDRSGGMLSFARQY